MHQWRSGLDSWFVSIIYVLLLRSISPMHSWVRCRNLGHDRVCAHGCGDGVSTRRLSCLVAMRCDPDS